MYRTHPWCGAALPRCFEPWCVRGQNAEPSGSVEQPAQRSLPVVGFGAACVERHALVVVVYGRGAVRRDPERLPVPTAGADGLDEPERLQLGQQGRHVPGRDAQDHVLTLVLCQAGRASAPVGRYVPFRVPQPPQTAL
jgi:hypothetical protein